MVVGSLFYIAGLTLMASAQGLLSVMIGGGMLIGTSLACTAAAIAMSVAARAVPAAVRSTVLGIVSAAGSLGALVVGADRADCSMRAMAGASAWPVLSCCRS